MRAGVQKPESALFGSSKQNLAHSVVKRTGADSRGSPRMSFDLGTRTELVPNGDCFWRRDTARAMSQENIQKPERVPQPSQDIRPPRAEALEGRIAGLSESEAMVAQENVEIVRRAVEAMAARRRYARRVTGRDICRRCRVGLLRVPHGRFCRPSRQRTGRPSLVRSSGSTHSGWTSYEPEAREFIEAGENVVSVIHEKVSIGDSGVFLERDLFHVWTLSDGLVAKWRSFETREPRPSKPPGCRSRRCHRKTSLI